MESPELHLSDDETDVEELLSQFDEENLLELNLNSFRYGSGEFIFEDKLDHSETADIVATPLSARYEKLQSQLPREGDARKESNDHAREATKVVLDAGNDREETKKVDDALDPDFTAKQATVNSPSISLAQSLTTDPVSTIAAKNRSFKAPSPPIASSKSSCPSCFCIPPMKMFRRSFRRPSSNPNGKLPGLISSSMTVPSASDGVVRTDEEHATERGQRDTDMDLELELELEQRGQKQERKGGCGTGGGMLVDPRTFSVKERERELRRVSKKERQLTEEAERFVQWVSTASARLDIEQSDEERGGKDVGRK